MPYISLTKGQKTLVDDCDFDDLMAIETGRRHWCFSNSGYAVLFYTAEDDQRTTLYMHRLVMERMLGGKIPLGLQVDHISQMRLDNRRENLRVVTRSQNQANKGIAVNNGTGYKGVSLKKDGRYESRIKFGEKRFYLGRYESPITAARVYDQASRILNGIFAGVNFPEEAPSESIAALLRPILFRYGLLRV